jgi:hypothetical protein
MRDVHSVNRFATISGDAMFTAKVLFKGESRVTGTGSTNMCGQMKALIRFGLTNSIDTFP